VSKAFRLAATRRRSEKTTNAALSLAFQRQYATIATFTPAAQEIGPSERDCS
jgi:hypothetical protein